MWSEGNDEALCRQLAIRRILDRMSTVAVPGTEDLELTNVGCTGCCRDEQAPTQSLRLPGELE